MERAYERSRMAVAMLYSPSLALALGRRWALWSPWIAVAALLLMEPVRRRIFGLTWRTLHRGNSRALATRFYSQALDLLGAHGLRRSRDQTPMEFAQSLGGHPVAASLTALTCMYNSIRFGAPEAPVRHAEVEVYLRALRESLRRPQESAKEG
jgi:hypothetical protein